MFSPTSAATLVARRTSPTRETRSHVLEGHIHGAQGRHLPAADTEAFSSLGFFLFFPPTPKVSSSFPKSGTSSEGYQMRSRCTPPTRPKEDKQKNGHESSHRGWGGSFHSMSSPRRKDGALKSPPFSCFDVAGKIQLQQSQQCLDVQCPIERDRSSFMSAR